MERTERAKGSYIELPFSMMIRDASRRWWQLLVGLYCNSLPESPQPTPCIQPHLLLPIALLLKPRQVQPTKARLRMESTRGRESQEQTMVVHEVGDRPNGHGEMKAQRKVMNAQILWQYWR